jgi:hypothetical protein
LQVCAVKAPGRRRSPQGHAAGHRHSGRGRGYHRRLGISARERAGGRPGRAKKITVDKDNTTIVEGRAHVEIEGRVKEVRGQVDKTTSDYDREKLQERRRSWCGRRGRGQGGRFDRNRDAGRKLSLGRMRSKKYHKNRKE